MLVREHLPHHLQTNRMVVAVHLIHQPLAPQAPRSSEFLRPCDRQWSLTHVAIAAEEVLVIVIVQAFGDGETGRSLVRAYFIRSEERRVGKEGVRTGRTRWSQYH